MRPTDDPGPSPAAPRLLVTLSGVEPGVALDTATALADELDARRVTLTLLVGPRPHPEVVAWARARRRVGDAVLLHGAGGGAGDIRLPAHEARLHLAGALRSRDALGLPVDGVAAPGRRVSAGVRRALGSTGLAELSLLVDADGVHRLGRDGTPVDSCPATAPRSWRAPRLRPARRPARAGALRHVALAATAASGALAAVDAALDAGATPATPSVLVAAERPGRTGRAGRTGRRDAGHDPEHWSITA